MHTKQKLQAIYTECGRFCTYIFDTTGKLHGVHSTSVILNKLCAKLWVSTFSRKKCPTQNMEQPGKTSQNPEIFPVAGLKPGKNSGFRVGTWKNFRFPGAELEPGKIPGSNLELRKVTVSDRELEKLPNSNSEHNKITRFYRKFIRSEALLSMIWFQSC